MARPPWLGHHSDNHNCHSGIFPCSHLVQLWITCISLAVRVRNLQTLCWYRTPTRAFRPTNPPTLPYYSALAVIFLLSVLLCARRILNPIFRASRSCPSSLDFSRPKMSTADTIETCSCLCEAWLAAQAAKERELDISYRQDGTLEEQRNYDCLSEVCFALPADQCSSNLQCYCSRMRRSPTPTTTMKFTDLTELGGTSVSTAARLV